MHLLGENQERLEDRVREAGSNGDELQQALDVVQDDD